MSGLEIVEFNAMIISLLAIINFPIVLKLRKDFLKYLPGISCLILVFVTTTFEDIIFFEFLNFMENLFTITGVMLFLFVFLLELHETRKPPIKGIIIIIAMIIFIAFTHIILFIYWKNNPLNIFEGFVSIIALIFYFIGIILSTFIYRKKGMISNFFLILFMVGGFLHSLGNIFEHFSIWDKGDEFSDSFFVLLATLLMIIGFIIILEEKLKESEKMKLKEIDRIKSELVTRISHELKTPLISIYSTSQYLLNFYKEELNDKIYNLIEIINKGGERLKQLTNNLIDSYYIEIKDFELKKQEVHLSKIVRMCINDLSYLIKERELLMNVDIREEIHLKLDKRRIKQVIMNLISNAINNTLPKGKIAVELQEYDLFVEIKIEDDGIGLTINEKDKIFKRFGKIERYGKGMEINTEGSGLGLYLSKEIVELHGGKIYMESEGRHEGSTFIVRLPKQ